MDKLKLFVDETRRLVNEEIPEYDVSWLTVERLQGVPSTCAQLCINTFVKVNSAQECSPVMFQKNLEILRQFLEQMEQNRWGDILQLKMDPRLYMNEEELAERVAAKLFEALDKPASVLEEESPDMEQLARLFAHLQPPMGGQKRRRKVRK